MNMQNGPDLEVRPILFILTLCHNVKMTLCRDIMIF